MLNMQIIDQVPVMDGYGITQALLLGPEDEFDLPLESSPESLSDELLDLGADLSLHLVANSDMTTLPDDQGSMEGSKSNAEATSGLSYIAVIAKAIQSVPGEKMLLADIYEWISRNQPNFSLRGDQSWRNSVRHTLSLNECFIKAGRSEGGKGNYWAIHPANVRDFARGDFRRRQARMKVRQYGVPKSKQQKEQRQHQQMEALPVKPEVVESFSRDQGFVAMTVVSASVSDLVDMFGSDAILTPQEQEQRSFISQRSSYHAEDGQNQPTSSHVFQQQELNTCMYSCAQMNYWQTMPSLM